MSREKTPAQSKTNSLYDKQLEQEVIANLITNRIVGTCSLQDEGYRWLIHLIHSDDFHVPQHVTIFQAIKWLLDLKRPITLDNILFTITKRSITNDDTIIHILHAIGEISKDENDLCRKIVALILQSQKRKIYQVCNDAINMCYAENADPNAIKEYIKKNI